MASPETRELRPVPGGVRQERRTSRAPAQHRAARGVVVIASHEQEQPSTMTVFPIASERAKKLFDGGGSARCWRRMAKRRHLS